MELLGKEMQGRKQCVDRIKAFFFAKAQNAPGSRSPSEGDAPEPYRQSAQARAERRCHQWVFCARELKDTHASKADKPDEIEVQPARRRQDIFLEQRS